MQHQSQHVHRDRVLPFVYSCAKFRGAEVCMWLDPSHRQAKDNEKNSGVDGSLTSCGDAQKESENKAFIQVFHPIQSVKSTNAVTLASLSTAKPAKHNEKNSGVDGSLTYCGDAQKESENKA